jgi:DNA-3-methyladenine glycosylase
MPKTGCFDRRFYERRTELVARELVGHYLIRRILFNKSEHLLGGRIVETEAYGGTAEDRASHAYRGQTNRNAAMFGIPGRAYVYFTYGNHHCFNVTARDRDQDAGAVLIRSIMPTQGIDVMQSFRGKNELYSLTSGPGKLTQALGISRSFNGIDLTDEESEIHIQRGRHKPSVIVSTPRIGITKALDKHWRFADSTSPFLSRSLGKIPANSSRCNGL